MRVKELIEKLKEFPLDMEVEISDGFNLHFYSTDNISMEKYEHNNKTVLDIGIGGCEID